MTPAIIAFLEHPPAWVEIAGYTLVALVALELVVGRNRLSVPGRGFRRTHVAIAWSMAAVMAFHSMIGIGHALVGYLARL